jgi:hypothetical protein
MNRLSDHDLLGRCNGTLAEVSSQGSVTWPLVQGCHEGGGQLTVTSEEVSSCMDKLELQFMAKTLDKLSWFGRPNPFLRFSSCNPSGQYSVVHRTEHVPNTLNPVWSKFSISLRALCNSDLDRDIRVECFDHNGTDDRGHDGHALIGQVHVTARQLMKGPGQENVFHFSGNPNKKASNHNKSSSKVHLIYCEVQKVYSFLDYVRGGTDLACTFAIDFTASNGSPNLPSSLHYISPGKPQAN